MTKLALAFVQLGKYVLDLTGSLVDPLLQRCVQLTKAGFRIAALLVEPRFLEGDRGLPSDPGDDQLVLDGEAVGLGMGEDQAANHIAGGGDNRDTEVADDRQKAVGRPLVRSILAVARVLTDIARADDARAASRLRK